MMHGGRQPVALYTPAELAKLFGISERQLLDWRRMNGWPCVKVGRTIRFTQSQVDDILARHSQTSTKSDAAAAVIPGQSKASAARAARAS